MDQKTNNILSKFITNYQSLNGEILDEVNLFMWLWPVFEWNYLNKKAELASLKKFSERPEILEIFGKNSCATISFEYFKNRYSTGKDAQTRLEALLGTQQAKKTIANTKSTIETGLSATDPNQKVLGLLWITFRLRNNLFHGGKSDAGFEDQLDNFKHANNLLSLWLSI
ncbi:MAG: hypothetical protein KUG74_01330 [Rhodobacteraceae bacterium]|nr:hypothetical protein [Paracoccaceae bacterium]